MASTAKLDLVRARRRPRHRLRPDDFADGTRHRYDLIIDIAGNPSLSRLRRALTPTGTAVIVGGEDGGSLTGGMNRQLRALISLFIRQRLDHVLNKERASDLERLTALIEAGQVTPSRRPHLPARPGRRRHAPPRPPPPPPTTTSTRWNSLSSV